MIKKLIAGFVLGTCLWSTPRFAYASEDARPGPQQKTLEELEINRSMLTRFRVEYEKLKRDAAQKPASTLLKKQLLDTEYKLKALDEDASKLMSALPEEERAQEFLKYIAVKMEKVRLPEEPAPTIPEPSFPAKEPSYEKKPSGNDRLYQMHEQALALVAQNKFAEAVKIYEEIILLNPNDDEAFMILGHTYMLMGEYKRSGAAFKNAIRLDRQNVNDIAPFYEKFILKNPNDDLAYTHLGYVYLMLGDYDKAEDAFNEALSLNPENPPAAEGLRILSRE